MSNLLDLNLPAWGFSNDISVDDKSIEILMKEIINAWLENWRLDQDANADEDDFDDGNDPNELSTDDEY